MNFSFKKILNFIARLYKFYFLFSFPNFLREQRI